MEHKLRHRIFYLVFLAVIIFLCYAIWFMFNLLLEIRMEIEEKTYSIKNESADLQIKLHQAIRVNKPKIVWERTGLASWYDYGIVDKDNGGIDIELPFYSTYTATAASREFVKRTCLKVTHVTSQKSVNVRVNDYGPAIETGRIIDLSSYAFKQLAPLELGEIEVGIEVLDKNICK